VRIKTFPLAGFLVMAGIMAVCVVCAVCAAGSAPQRAAGDEETVANLDTEYQQAVKDNDAATMARILADNFVLVSGRGGTQTKADLLSESRKGNIKYEHQEDTNRTVRVWGDTAVVTALLWGKGTVDGKAFDHKLWFSDVYVRTKSGWRYVFAQASLPLEAK